MTCPICKRASCVESFHSIEEQQAHEAKTKCGYDELEAERDELRDLLQQDSEAREELSTLLGRTGEAQWGWGKVYWAVEMACVDRDGFKNEISEFLYNEDNPQYHENLVAERDRYREALELASKLHEDSTPEFAARVTREATKALNPTPTGESE